MTKKEIELLSALDDIIEQAARTDAGIWLDLEEFKDHIVLIAGEAKAKAE